MRFFCILACFLWVCMCVVLFPLSFCFGYLNTPRTAVAGATTSWVALPRTAALEWFAPTTLDPDFGFDESSFFIEWVFLLWYLPNREKRILQIWSNVLVLDLVGGAFKFEKLPTLKNLVLRFLLGEKVWEKLKYGFNSSKGTEKNLVWKTNATKLQGRLHSAWFLALISCTLGFCFVLCSPSHSTYYVIFIQYRVKKSNF